jgi:uncharacterized protein YciW
LTFVSDLASAPSNSTARTTATLPSAGFGLAAGDAVIIGLFRSTINDTCTQTARVTGIRVLYT